MQKICPAAAGQWSQRGKSSSCFTQASHSLLLNAVCSEMDTVTVRKEVSVSEAVVMVVVVVVVKEAAVVPCVTVVSTGGAEGCGEVVCAAVVSGIAGGERLSVLSVVPVAGLVGTVGRVLSSGGDDGVGGSVWWISGSVGVVSVFSGYVGEVVSFGTVSFVEDAIGCSVNVVVLIVDVIGFSVDAVDAVGSVGLSVDAVGCSVAAVGFSVDAVGSVGSVITDVLLCADSEDCAGSLFRDVPVGSVGSCTDTEGALVWTDAF